MVAGAGLLSGQRDVLRKAALEPSDGRAVVQIAARDPDPAAACARLAEAAGAAIVDVNFGCPAKKVARSACGAALMREPERAVAVFTAVRDAVSIPATAKMRLGWDAASISAPDLARRLEDAGAAMIAVHGRTRAQFYDGSADWEAVGAVVDAVAIPVVVNGDIVDASSARAALRASSAAGVMVGRGARGAPWRLAEIAAGLEGRRYTPPPPAARARLAAAYFEASLRHHGRVVGARAARKHLGWRLDEIPGGRDVRASMLAEADPDRVLEALEAFADRLEGRVAA